VRWSRFSQHYAVSLTETSRFGALLTLGDQVLSDCGRTITCALTRGVGADARCRDRVGGQRRWRTAIRLVEAALRLLGSLLPVAA
jgi:hypothetical protein